MPAEGQENVRITKKGTDPLNSYLITLTSHIIKELAKSN
jgi:hypothetical protein